MLNSEARIDETSRQYHYLEETLNTIDRKVTPWVIVSSHRPIYYVYSKGGKEDPTFQVIEPLLLKYQVDLVIAGHVHNTYLSCPVINGTCVQPSYEG